MNDQEILEALKKSAAMPPVLCMNQRSVIFVDYADGHGEAKIQVNNWFRCPCCSSIVGERTNRSAYQLGYCKNFSEYAHENF